MQYNEKDMEDWLYDNPMRLVGDGWIVERWIGRQLELSSGRIDLIGLTLSTTSTDIRRTVIVELKNTDITADALTQVMRYQAVIDNDLFDMYTLKFYGQEKQTRYMDPIMAIVASGWISDNTFFEANIFGIHCFKFELNKFSPSISRISWKDNISHDMKYDESKYSNCIKSLHNETYRITDNP